MGKIDKEYTVLIDEDAHFSLQKHAEFLARVNVPAAERLMATVYNDIGSLDHAPTRFQRHINELYPDGDYRAVLTAKRYKIVYEIYEELDIVHVVNVIDCRMDETPE